MAATAMMLFLMTLSVYLVSNTAQELVEGMDYVADISFSLEATTLDPEDDGVSKPIVIRAGFPIGPALQYYAYVGTNGIISFGKGFRFYTPSPFPTSSSAIQDHIIIAPFWSDNDVRMSGSISYEVFENPMSGGMKNISDFISSQIGTSFIGSWMLLAEWSEVHPFPHGVNGTLASYEDYITKTNTYQAVLITNSTNSYAVFTYNCDRMSWSGDVWGNYATIGYSVKGLDYVNNPFTNLDQAHQIACLNSQERISWSNVLLSLPVSLTGADVQKQSCEAMIREDNILFGSVFDIVPTLEPCPCNQIQARSDWRFRSDDNVDIDGLLCYFQRFPSPNNASQYCCYSSNGALTQTLNETYGTNMVMNHPLTHADAYFQYDRTFRETCCNAGLCSAYTSRRPGDQCSGYKVPSLGWVVGSLHFTTLDGLSYTFNGFGDYLLLNDTESTFQVQVRTKKTTSDKYNTTQLEAMSIGEEGNIVLVSQNTNGSIELELNNATISVDELGSYESGEFYTNSNSTVRIQSLTKDLPPKSVLISFANGVNTMVNVSTNNVLHVSLWVPESFPGNAAGLLGNFNDYPSDDLPVNATDGLIHEFGENWKLNTSYFDEQFFQPFTPTLLQDVLNSSVDDTLPECMNNPYCIFDAKVTGEISIGEETAEAMERNIQYYNELANFPPEIGIDGDSVMEQNNFIGILLMSSETPVDFSFTVSDKNEEDNFTTEFDTYPADLLTAKPNADDEFGNYSFSWSVGDPTDLQISVISTDDKGASSQTQLQVFICVCENGGLCPLMGSMSKIGNNINFDTSTVVLPCDCNQGWTGPHCNVDIDGCSEGGCHGDFTCSDGDGANVTCPDCGPGLLKDGEKCYDLYDCEESSCDQACVNNFGFKFSCECYAGYKMHSGKCQDIDECAGYNECHQQCNNTEGSYECYCMPGYSLAENNQTCQERLHESGTISAAVIAGTTVAGVVLLAVLLVAGIAVGVACWKQHLKKKRRVGPSW